MVAKFMDECKIKGYDSVYVAISYVFHVKLITLDKELIKRSKKFIIYSDPGNEVNREKV
jgi:predicted nucleic acid-binding protein